MDLNQSYAHAQSLHEASEWWPAIEAYRDIVTAHPNEVRAWALMGLCATQAGELALAASALQCAATLEPTAANIHFRLGIVLYQQGFAADAEVPFRRTVELDPSNLDAQQNLAAVLVDQGRHREAQPYFEQLLAQDPNQELAWAGLANVHTALGDMPRAIVCMEKALALNPGNTATRHLLRAAKGETPAHPDWRYVENFFDDYAARFEKHLVDRLDYVAPQTLAALIKTDKPLRDVLDLGCGTGLFGAAWRAVQPDAHLIGVDLSHRMVQAAQARNIYKAVHKGEAEDYLAHSKEAFDLIAATDVFIYVGDVSALFTLACARLRSGGLLAFTVETTNAPGFKLEASGRYAHNRNDLAALAVRTGFKIIAETYAPLRKHRGETEEGLYMVLQR
jgi:predicted TPR repeat methyltransferase